MVSRDRDVERTRPDMVDDGRAGALTASAGQPILPAVRYRVLACDYDGTLARDGAVTDSTRKALERTAASGRRLVLVTGRQLPDLLRVFPAAGLFDFIVAENGGLLYTPATREEHALAPEPPAELVSALRARGVPVSVGRSVIATWQPHETTVLTAIRELGLELHVLFNKGAVMVLPSGVNKRSGLDEALSRLGLSAHNCVGVGDAENDHAFLSVCECAVAVANALPAVKHAADWVTAADHGAGVEELVERLVGEDLRSLAPKLSRHHVLLGTFEDGTELTVPPYGPVMLVAGASGGGKSTAITGLLERLGERGYQVCIVDPEGDYDGFDSAVVAGTSEQPPDVEQVLRVLAKPQNHAVINLLGVPIGDRPAALRAILPRLLELRERTGRPHWIVIDEAHHVLSDALEPTPGPVLEGLQSATFVTVHPDRLHPAVLGRVDLAVFVGPVAEDSLGAFARAIGEPPPPVASDPAASRSEPRVGAGQAALIWKKGEAGARRATVAPPRSSLRRHRRKYAHGELGPDRSFYFRGPDEKLNLRAQNLHLFTEMASGVDDDTWLYHLRRGDYSRWILGSIKNDLLASRIGEVEADPALSPLESRRRVRALIEAEYTLPP